MNFLAWADTVIGLGLAFLLIAVAELLACIAERQVRGGPVESPDWEGLHRDRLRYATISPRPNGL